mmetsp:Transcript_10062/g.29726  ORF Transcript_10062/g.29726 Transcript_10062/m.29726 type:complete len:207 (+) Transcript_10062:491-1111(+)
MRMRTRTGCSRGVDHARLNGAAVRGLSKRRRRASWKGSTLPSSKASYSAIAHAQRAARCEMSSERKATAMSVPAEMPLDVQNDPSQAHRAVASQHTPGRRAAISSWSSLLVVARRPSRRPVEARSKEPVQTDRVTWAVAATSCSLDTNAGDSTRWKPPLPPGTKRTSASPGFRSWNEPSTTTRGEPDVATSAVPLAETKESLKQRP